MYSHEYKCHLYTIYMRRRRIYRCVSIIKCQCQSHLVTGNLRPATKGITYCPRIAPTNPSSFDKIKIKMCIRIDLYLAHMKPCTYFAAQPNLHIQVASFLGLDLKTEHDWDASEGKQQLELLKTARRGGSLYRIDSKEQFFDQEPIFLMWEQLYPECLLRILLVRTGIEIKPWFSSVCNNRIHHR